MKKIYALLVLVVLTVSTFSAKAQEWSTGLDIYSSYIWRGSKFGTGPAFQPFVDFTAGGFSIGAWGSVSAGGWDGAYETADDGTVTYVGSEGLEMDLYAGYSFDFGLSVTVTDYYFGGDFMDFGNTHAIEPMLGYGVGDLSLTAAYEISGEATYLEAAYSFGAVDLAVGAGNAYYTEDASFTLCNISLSTAKDIEITDKFTLPVSGSVTLNPSTGGFFIAVGISL